jgi:hypothetical protein
MKDYKKKMMVFLPAVDERRDETNQKQKKHSDTVRLIHGEAPE